MFMLFKRRIVVETRDCNPGSVSQSRDSGLASTGSRDPGAQCTCHYGFNPGLTFSISGFGIETFLMPCSHQDYVMRPKTIITQPLENHTVHNSHTDGCGTYMVGW
jgi:hypothetical protein